MRHESKPALLQGMLDRIGATKVTLNIAMLLAVRSEYLPAVCFSCNFETLLSLCIICVHPAFLALDEVRRIDVCRMEPGLFVFSVVLLFNKWFRKLSGRGA